nr:MAG TPA: hypothetical protein [Caudoviricetes sp.]
MPPGGYRGGSGKTGGLSQKGVECIPRKFYSRFPTPLCKDLA